MIKRRIDKLMADQESGGSQVSDAEAGHSSRTSLLYY